MFWHNDEAQGLAARIQNIVNTWKAGSICPSEFLFQLDLAVTEAKKAKQDARDLIQ